MRAVMRRIVVLWVMLMSKAFTVNAQDSSYFEHPQCRSSTNCVENKSTNEIFYYDVNGYEIVTRFRDRKCFELQCNNGKIDAEIPVNNQDLPVMSRLVTVDEVKIEGCIVPSNGSYAEALKRMNVITMSKLFLKGQPTNPKLERHHLQGLNISELIITANDSTNPPRPKHDYLKDLLELRKLKLENVVPEPEALKLLPVTLEYLSLAYTELQTAQHALGNAGAWLNRLHSLSYLDVFESSDISTKGPSFFTLPKLVSLPKLTNLTLNSVPLNSSNLADSLKNSSIEHLVLVSCELNNLPKTLFEGVNLTSLTLTYNNLTEIDDVRVFSHLQWLTYLDLSDNELSRATLLRILSPLAHAPLKTLEANDNPLGSLCDDPDSGSGKSDSGLPKTLRQLKLQGTGATRICSDWIENDALMHIDLRNNRFDKLTYNDLKMKRTAYEAEAVQLNLSKNPNLRMVNISSYDIRHCYNYSLLSSKDSNNRTRARVKLKLDSLVCDCIGYWQREALHRCLLDLESDVECVTKPHVLPDTTLLGYNLTGDHCPYNDCLQGCSCWKRPSDNATVVLCAGALPKEPRWPPSALNWPLVLHFAPGTLAAVPRTSFVELYAANNYIASLEEMVIDESLVMLDLRNNSIEHISEATAMKLSANHANRSVYLAGNQFACSCFDAPAFELLKHVAQDWNITQCMDKSNISEKTKFELCFFALLVPVLVGVITLVLVLLTVGLLLLHFKSRVRKFMFKYNLCLRCILTPEDNADDSKKTHDVFLSYANDDLERVIELRSGLESRGYSTIDHCRDWQPGEPITVQIERSVLCARRTLLLISDSYAKSKWALEEFYAAHNHAMELQTARVLIVRYNLNEPEKLPQDLQLYLKYNTYLNWNDENFWYKLCQVMPPLRFDIDRR